MSGMLELAERVELSWPGRDLDADIYEALGYQVKRAPQGRNGMSWRYFDQEGRRWLAMAHLTTSVDDCSRFIERRHPGWAWNVGNTGPNDEPHACVTLDDPDCTDLEGSAAGAAIALAAALCRAEAAMRRK